MYVARRGLLSWKDREFLSEASLETLVLPILLKKVDEESRTQNQRP